MVPKPKVAKKRTPARKVAAKKVAGSNRRPRRAVKKSAPKAAKKRLPAKKVAAKKVVKKRTPAKKKPAPAQPAVLRSNAAAADATVEALRDRGLLRAEHDALVTLIRRLARVIDVPGNGRNAALVREYRQAVGVLLDAVGGGTDGEDPMDRILRVLAG